MIEKWGRIRPNPIYESQNLTNFTLVSGEVIEHSKPTSFEEAVNGPKSKKLEDVHGRRNAIFDWE